MKRPVLIVVFCLCALPLYGQASVIQANIGGSITTTLSGGGTLTTSTGHFASNTAAGSLLLLVAWAREDATSGTINGTFNFTATTSGFSWTKVTGNAGFLDNATAKNYGTEQLFYIPGASSMSSATTTVVGATVNAADHCTCSLEFALFEVTGISAKINDNLAAANDTGTPTQPGINENFTGHTYFALVDLTGFPGSNLTAAAGWTLGPNGTVATIGQSAYKVDATGFTGLQFSGTLGLWDAHAIWFSIAAPAAGVSRHRGFIF